MVLYELTHLFSHSNGNPRYSPKFLGFFDSYENIQAAIEFYKSKPGFKDNPDTFSIRYCEVSGNPIGNTIYKAIVYLHTNDYSIEHEVELGLYTSEIDAASVVTRYCKDNKSLQHVFGLEIEGIINKCIIGTCDWPEGFEIAK